MDPITAAAIAGGASSLIGGFVGAHQDEIEAQKQRDLAYDQIALQREFAQNGISWKVQDAQKAGIHPLYAMGASTHSFSPVSVGGGGGSIRGDMAREMGQNVGRAATAAVSGPDQELHKLTLASAQADLDGKLIENQLKASELQRLNGSPTKPMPFGADNFVPGQGDSGSLVKVKPLERTASQPGRLAQEAGWRPDVSFSRTDTGLTPMVPESLSESLEDDFIGKLLWRIRNNLVPNFSKDGAPAASQLPKGKNFWGWSHLKQEWQPRRTPENWYSGWAPKGSGRSLKY